LVCCCEVVTNNHAHGAGIDGASIVTQAYEENAVSQMSILLRRRARHLPDTCSGVDIHGASIRWPFVCSIVAIREAMYLCALLSCLRYNRALLLVDVTASVHDNGGGGWKWLVLYAIAPVRRPLRHNDSSVRLITRRRPVLVCCVLHHRCPCRRRSWSVRFSWKVSVLCR
jgi:hypothetical protein